MTKTKDQSRGASQAARSQGDETKSRAALDQSFYETNFGGKYLGQMRREGSGQFGSLPLYDNYGDNADA
jgi:hypothetical protein